LQRAVKRIKAATLERFRMVKSPWVYKQLSRFRAGIEAGISWLKRVFGLRRCHWSSFRSFKATIWASVVSTSLLIIARATLA
jgi:IS5 family transposase